MALGGQLKKIAGPAYIASSLTNIFTPSASTIETYLFQIDIVNKTATDATFSLFVGLTGAGTGGTEVMGGTRTVPAYKTISHHWPKGFRMTSADFLVGIAGTASALVITVLAEQIVV